MGAGKWRDRYSALIRGLEVVLFYENDCAEKRFAGQEHAKATALSLLKHDCTIRIVDLPIGKDIGDFLDADPENRKKLPDLIGAAKPLTSDDVERWAANFHGSSASPNSVESAENTFEPALEIDELQSVHSFDSSGIQFAVDGVVALSAVTAITGDAGAGKTTLVTSLAGHVAVGEPFLDIIGLSMRDSHHPVVQRCRFFKIAA